MVTADPAEIQDILGILEANAQLAPSSPAILGVEGTRVTHAEVLAHASGIAGQLRDRGIDRTQAVIVAMPNGPEMLIGCLGAMTVARCVPVNTASSDLELEHLASDIGARAVIASAQEPARAARVARTLGVEPLEVDLTRVPPAGSAVWRRPLRGEVALVLHTAGTTARPKQVPLTHANLVAASANVVASLALTPTDRCLNVMPLFHSHGLLGAALSSLRATSSILCAPGLDPRRFFDWAAQYECTWYTAASTVHQLVLEAPGAWPGLRLMRSASGPLAPAVAVGLEQRFGAPMIEVYGMTEAYQICANPLPPGERRVGSVGLPTGTEVRLLTDAGLSNAPEVTGEIVVRGPAVFDGYAAPDGANDDAFVDGWFRTGDVGHLDSAGYLTITGRLKEQINRGGEKISPREVEEALLDHPLVEDVMAFAIADPRLGEDVGVAVVTRSGAPLELPEVRAYLRDRLAPFKVPRRVVVVDRIPKSAAGKPLRIEFARTFSTARDDAPASPAPMAGGSTREWLADVWRELLGLDHLPGSADRFFDLGGDSLAVMELVVRVEDELDVDLPLLELLDVPSLGELAERIDMIAAGGSTATLLRRYRAGSSGDVLVLVPGQMGLAIGLNLIADAIDDDVEVWMFDYPGHRSGEQPEDSIEHLAQRLVAELEVAGISHPSALYGNSLGSWVAFEAARQLSDAGRRPRLVGIGDMYSPYLARRAAPTRPPLHQRLRNRAQRATRQLRQRLRQLAGPQRPTAVARRDRVVAAAERAMRSYRPHPYDGALLVVTADERGPRFGRNLGWDHHVTGPLTHLRVTGGHSEMHRNQAAAIGAALSSVLRQAR